MSHFLDFIVRCGDVRISGRVSLGDARKDAYRASLDPQHQGGLVLVERSGRVLECWSQGERRT